MNTRIFARYLFLGLLVLLNACSTPGLIVQPTASAPLPTVLPAQTSRLTNTPSPLSTQTQAAAKDTAVPATATQAAVEQAEATPALASSGCQDSAQYITDDGLDGSTYGSNTAFTKTWTLKNTGSCTWNDSYMVSQVSGTYMTQQPAYYFIPQGKTVAPGQTVNISIGMTSPVGNGNYRSDWGLMKKDGPLMPIQGGVNGKAFYVKIRVNDGSVAFGKVTAASITIEREEGSGAICTAGATYFVHAFITADGATTAEYEILSSAGQIAAGNFEGSNQALSPSESGTLTFDKADTKTIDFRFVGPYPYPKDITVILRVNGGEFHETKLGC